MKPLLALTCGALAMPLCAASALAEPILIKRGAADELKRLEAWGVELPVAPTLDSPAISESETATTRERVLDYALSRYPDELVEVVVALEAIPFPHSSRLATMSKSEKDDLLREGVATVVGAQLEFIEYAESLGAKVAESPGLVNHVHAWVPPGVMEEVLAHPDVRDVYPSWGRVVPTYEAEQNRQETHLAEFWDAGIKGERGGIRTLSWAAGADDIKLAVIEVVQSFTIPNFLDTSHPGWADWLGGPSRVRSIDDCDSGICGPPTTPNPFIASHGTYVTSIAAGDISTGQDPNISDPLERKRRSGVAPEASILYFTVKTSGDVAAAMSWALLKGADVINASLGDPSCGPCSSTANCGGLNEVIRTVSLLNTLVVASAGNRLSSGGSQCPGTASCDVCYPAVRPEVLAVGNVDTPGGIDYGTAQIAVDSSRGLINVNVGGQHAAAFPSGVAIPAVSISAPGRHSLFYESGGTYSAVELSGTSFAAPVISAGARLLREELGSAVDDARMLKAVVLSMGDATGGVAGLPGVRVGWSDTFGPAGKARFHPWSAVVAPKDRRLQSLTIEEDDLLVFNRVGGSAPLHPSVTEWKMATFVDAPDLSQIPYLLFSYWDVCTPTHQLIAYDLNPGLERLVSVESPAIDSACVEVRVLGYSVPPGGVEMFIVDYYHSGDPTEH